MKSSKLLSITLSVVITVLVGTFITFADNWTAPVSTPPAGNTDAPINVGGNAQIKAGGFIVGAGLTSSQTALFVPNGNILVGSAQSVSAPNGSGGNVSVNDLYIRSVGKWASELGGGAAAAVAHGSQSYSTAGTYSFVAPGGVSSVNVEVWGAGGGGLGSCIPYNRSTQVTSGPGGGAGAYAKKVIAVVAGDTYQVVVGRGGNGSLGSADCRSASRGAGSSFASAALVANGGGGAVYNDFNAVYAGSGGVATGGSGVTSQRGLDGFGGTIVNGGTSPSESTGGNGGNAPLGGIGGVGTTGAGPDGVVPGGGGAGGGIAKTGPSATGFRTTNVYGIVYANGGNGADGKIVISW